VSVQICEGIWRNRCNQRLMITRCEPVGGQQWTDGIQRYSDDGKYSVMSGQSNQDLVAFVGLLPDNSQRAPVSRPAETESTTARYISTNEALNEKTAEIDRLRIELQETYAGWSDSNSALADQTAKIELFRTTLTEQTAEIDRLRSENESLTVRLQRAEMVAAEAMQKWETTEQVCLRIITALAGVRS